MKLVSDAAEPCQLLDNGRGWRATVVFAAATLRWLNSSQMWQMYRCLLLQRSLAGGEAAYDVSMYQLTSLSTVSRQAAQTLTVCAPFLIIV